MDSEVFDNFSVYKDKDGYVFIHMNIGDEDEFYINMFEYFFEESKILSYVENIKSLKFQPSKRAYTILYRELKKYIDGENLEVAIPELDSVVRNILEEEGVITFSDGRPIARKDKIGKIGEYIFSILLSEYFKFDCIIPKVHLQTDYNMNVYGIDTVFYSEIDDMLLFGESKFSMNLYNGIKLIKESLKDYKKQILDDYELVLCNRLYGGKLKCFADKYGEYTEVCVDFEEFISEAGVCKIGIPIFIAHGMDLDESTILKRINRIPKDNLFGLETIYYFISLPVIDKAKMIAIFTREIEKREKKYASLRKRDTK